MNTELDIVKSIYVSGNYANVFFSRDDVQKHLELMNDGSGAPPKGTNVMYTEKKLLIPKTKNEILFATPKQLREWVWTRD
ncbi:MAG: hypothetical protein ACW9W3_01885 [Candidatus Nitrosopumilus sp. bin_68KS]